MTPESLSSKRRSRPDKGKQDVIDYIKLFFLMLSNWYWFVLALTLMLTIAWLYNRYTIPTWQVTASVLIEDDRNNQSLTGPDQLLRGFGLRPGIQNLNNQLHILSSRSIIDQTLNELPFNIEYYHRGLVNKVALYPESPIVIYAESLDRFPEDVEFKFKLEDNNTFSLSANSKGKFKLNTKATFGDILDIEGGKIRIEQTSRGFTGENSGKKFYFIFHSRNKLVKSYHKRLKVESVSKEGSIISLSLKGTNSTMDMVFLYTLLDVFINNNLERKNKEAERTLKFIDDQLTGVSNSLSITEDKLQRFRSKNKVMDISAQGQQIINQAMNLENERARLVIESNYYEYLAEYLSKDMAGELPVSPATMGITDPGLTNLVLELANLQSQYFSKSLGEKNPMQSQLAHQLRNTRDALNETLKGVRYANKLSMNENTEQIRSINASASILPRTERELLGIEREFKLNDVLYSFLLEQRAEAQIQKASNIPDNEIIDNPVSDEKPLMPIPILAYLIALVAGLGIPLLAIISIQALDNVIKNEDVLERITELPIVGHLPHSEPRKEIVVLDEPSSRVAESFRSLRVRIQFFTKEIKSPVILITSSMPGEGKTFTAINLASAYSLMGKKTILVGFDLRRPGMNIAFGIRNENGISTWLNGDTTPVIKKTSFENLYILPAGPIPPNPAELIASEKTNTLINSLRESFDYIILDSAPVGSVSDSITLASLADATIILVRLGKTILPHLADTISGMKANGISGISLLVNDIPYGKIGYRYYARYGYNYKYSYDTDTV